MSQRYNPPPNWPAPREGWTPPPGWQPDPAWGPPPPGWQLYAEEKRGMGTGAKLAIVGGGVLVVLVACTAAIAGSGDEGDDVAETIVVEDVAPGDGPADAAPAPETSAVAPEPEASAAAIGTPVRDGSFEFVVSGVECGVPSVGNEFLNTTAQGQFCLVSLSVTNIGDEPQTFFDSDQLLYNADDQQFAADTEAGIYLEENQTFFQEINPGNALTGRVVFDVPGDMVPTRIELHDSAFSGGVDVALQ